MGPGPTDGADGGAGTIEARITDLVVRLVVVGLFAYWSLTLVAPFALILVWAVILAVALYPVFSGLRRMLGGHGVPAAAVITLAGLAVIIGPLAAIALGAADAAHALLERVREGSLAMPEPPAGVRDWPLVGERVFEAWSLAAENLEAAVQRFGPSLLQAGGNILVRIAAIWLGVLGFALSVVIAGFLFIPGPRLAEAARSFGRRIAAERGARFIDISGATIRNVSRGVIGVALIQSLLAGIVLALFGIPAAGAIAFAVLVLCIVQIGPVPVLLPVLIWVWMTLPSATALILTLLLAPVVVIDNVLKPLLVARGLATPMLVILVGVIGGTLSHGLIGLFLGPVVLTVFYDLLVAWVRTGPSGREAA
jgi:predicted PurR-regulated permease PerM